MTPVEARALSAPEYLAFIRHMEDEHQALKAAERQRRKARK